MARDHISRSVLAMMTAGVAITISLAGCSGGSGASSSSSPSAPAQSQSGTPSRSATPSQSPAQRSVPIIPLKKSKFYFMTKLSQAKLCGLLHGGEPAKILSSPAGPATYANTLGLGVVCTWSKSGGGELYIGVSTIFPWRGAQSIDKFAGDKPTTVGGHPADAAGPNGHAPYATAHVAIAGLNDPVVEFRAPTRAAVLKLASLVLPRLLAITSAG